MTAPGRTSLDDAMPHDLEAALADLRGAVAFPPTPDLVSAIARTLRPSADSPVPSDTDSTVMSTHPPAILSGAKDLRGRRRTGSMVGRRPRTVLHGGPRAITFAALAIVILLGGALALSGGLRSAVADRLGLRSIPGIRIELVDETPPTADTPTPTTSPVGAMLLLGARVTLEEARAAVPYPVAVPAGLGAPDEVFVRELGGGTMMVALVYRSREGLPEAAETGVGALLMQFPADADGADIAKKVLFGAGPEPSGSLAEVTVGGADGYWVTGASELMILEDPSAPFQGGAGRPSANVLIWASGGVTYRLETALGLPEALAIAESLAAGVVGTPVASP